MLDYRVETRIRDGGTLFIKKLPFQAGDKVEVIIRRHEDARPRETTYSLRGKPIRYADPFGSVAEEEWEAMR